MEPIYQIYEDLAKAEEKFEQAKKNYHAAVEFFEKVFKPIMPKAWQAKYIFADNRLCIINYNHEDVKEEAPLVSFKLLCDALNETGLSPKKKIADLKIKDYVFLDGIAEYKKDDISFEIHIRQCQVDKCEIEYTEVTEKKATLSGFCAEVLK